MKVKVLKGFVCDGKAAKVGAVVELKDSLGDAMIHARRAEKVTVNKAKKDKPKKDNSEKDKANS